MNGRRILLLVRKDFSLLRRDRAALVLTFLVPAVLIYVFGQVFGVNGSSGPAGIPLGIVNESAQPAAAKLVDALKADPAFRAVTTVSSGGGPPRPLAEGDLRALMHADRFRFAVVVPADVTGGSRPGVHLTVYSNPRNEIEWQMVNGILQRDLFSNAPQLIAQSFRERERALIGSGRLEAFDRALASAISHGFGLDETTLRQRIAAGDFALGPGASAPNSDLLGRVIRIDTVQVEGADTKSAAATQLVGGWAIQFLLFALTASATALFRERDAGIFERLLSGPVTRSDILVSKFVYGISLGLLQLLVLFAAGQILYGVRILPEIVPLAIVCLFAAAACTSFGMLIASAAGSPDAARGLSTFVILLMCAAGGAWFPVSFMPAFMQHLSRITLVYWSMEGFSQVLWAHASLLELAPTLGWLGLTTAILMGFSLWRFNRGGAFG